MPLHVKASDQAGLQGNLIFDPVGTNEYIKDVLVGTGWLSTITIPAEYAFLGTDVDFGKHGVLLEAQFSNYPFLLNNVLRSELFFKARVPLTGAPTEAVVIVTKAHMFPASNSTLYFEQAERQLTALAKNRVFDVPIRLVGLLERRSTAIAVRWTEYHAPRYSRTVRRREDRRYEIREGRTSKSRCSLRPLDE